VVYELSTELSTFGKDERIAAYRRNRTTGKDAIKVSVSKVLPRCIVPAFVILGVDVDVIADDGRKLLSVYHGAETRRRRSGGRPEMLRCCHRPRDSGPVGNFPASTYQNEIPPAGTRRRPRRTPHAARIMPATSAADARGTVQKNGVKRCQIFRSPYNYCVKPVFIGSVNLLSDDFGGSNPPLSTTSKQNRTRFCLLFLLSTEGNPWFADCLFVLS
jgi:hypothetical protein